MDSKIVVVLSTKGGVGKSTVSTNLSLLLASEGGKNVGLLDLDLCGPNVPLIIDTHLPYYSNNLNNIDKSVTVLPNNLWKPIEIKINNNNNILKVFSMSYITQDDNQSIIWRGPKKNQMIQFFLNNVDWSGIDYLIIDTPPGTSDEHITLFEALLKNKSDVSVVIVTTPSNLSIDDVKRTVDFCNTINVSIMGYIENMSEIHCPSCDFTINDTKNTDELSKKMTKLASLPFTHDVNCIKEKLRQVQKKLIN